MRDVVLNFWGNIGTSLKHNPRLTETCQMGAVNVLERGLYPPQAIRWDVRVAVSGEDWFERRNDLRSCFIQVSKALSELPGNGYKSFFQDILSRSTNTLQTKLSSSHRALTWIDWESAVWRARCVAHVLPNLAGEHLSKILGLYCLKHGSDIAQMHALLRGTFVDGIRMTRTFWMTRRDTMPFALKLSIVGISSVSNMTDKLVARCDSSWFRGEHDEIMRSAVVQSASNAGITFDRLCQCSAQAKETLDITLFSELLSVMSKLVYRKNVQGEIPTYVCVREK